MDADAATADTRAVAAGSAPAEGMIHFLFCTSPNSLDLSKFKVGLCMLVHQLMVGLGVCVKGACLVQDMLRVVLAQEVVDLGAVLAQEVVDLGGVLLRPVLQDHSFFSSACILHLLSDYMTPLINR